MNVALVPASNYSLNLPTNMADKSIMGIELIMDQWIMEHSKGHA